MEVKKKSERDWFFPYEAARALGVTHATVLRWIVNGHMPSVSNGLFIMVKRSFVEKIIQGRKVCVARKEECNASCG